MTGTTSLIRPKKVLIAIYIIVLSLLAGGIYSAIVISNMKHSFFLPFNGIRVMIIILILLVLSGYFYVLYKMFIGEKWARTIFLILTVSGFIWYPINNIFIKHGNIEAKYYLQTLTNIIPLLLLFSKEANEWYNRKNIGDYI
jgi:hypothetical protein